MGVCNFPIIAMLKISILLYCMVACTYAAEYQTFFQCIESYSFDFGRSKILEHLHTPDSPAYLTLLHNSAQNPRWTNATYQRPFLIMTAHEESEIRPVILCAKTFGHQVRINSGGHDYEGLSFRSPTPFIMVELSNLNRTMVDIEHESVWIQTGVKLGQLYYEISKKSRVHAFPGGICPTVGSGGHISGGGLGTLMRKYGLASDNILDARVMDVNGEILDRENMGEDLFWALKGGGGASFGVILAWKLRLVRVPENVTAFSVRQRLEPGNLGLLQKWQSNAHSVSNDLFVRILVAPVPINQTAKERVVLVTYNGLFLGPAEELVSLLNRTYPEFDLNIDDCFLPPRWDISCPEWPCIKKECFQVSWIKSVLYFYGKSLDDPPEILTRKTVNTFSFNKGTSDFLREPIPDEGWEMIREMLFSEDGPLMIMDPLGGKMDEISESETPYPHRKGNLFNIQYLNYWLSNTEEEVGKHVKWIRDMRRKMKPYVAKCPRTAYINYKDLGLGSNDGNYSYDGARVWGEKYFKGNFRRLAEVKGKVDPGNFFRNEQSIPVLL